MPATQPNRQELMNAGPHHAKLRVTAHVPSSVYVAGSDIAGKIDVECRAEKGLGLGTIMVELMAFQELNSRDHAATSTFIHTRRIFQGPSLPPSNAVLPEDDRGLFPPHHYPARRGITTFFFRFPLPLTSPASVDFGSGLARIRYEIRASASVAWKGERRLVTDSQDVQVVESAMQEVESAGTVVGESGKIWVQGKVLGGAVIAGQTCCIELHVKNHSSRKTAGVKVTLQRILHLDNPPPQHANLILSDTLVTTAFHSAEYCCPPGLEGVAKLVINVPRTARTVKGGSRESGEVDSDKTIPALFDIRASVNVRLCMGVGSKDLELSLPVVISHPAAITPESNQALSVPNHDTAHLRPSSPQSFYEPPRSPFAPPQSPIQSHYTGYSPYPPASPALPYTQIYFPPPSPQLPNILNYFPAPPTSPSMPMYPSLPMSPGPLMSPVMPMSPVLPMSPAPPYVPALPAPNPYQDQPQAPQHQAYLPEPPKLPVRPNPPYVSHAPQFPHTQSMPQIGLQQVPQVHDGLPAGNSLPPLPPRPTSAEPHVHEVGVDLPPSAGAPLSPATGRIQAANEAPDSVEGKGARASRISEHLHMSSRTRSMSPTGRRFPGARVRPNPIDPPLPPAVADIDPGVLSPRPVHSPLSEVMDRGGSADGGTGKAQVHDLERMAAEEEAEKASTRSVQQAPEQLMGDNWQVNSPSDEVGHQPVPPPGSQTEEQRNTGKASPRPLPPTRKDPPIVAPVLHGGTPVSPKKLQFHVTASTSEPNESKAPVVKPLEPMSTGLTALERRLTAKLESPRSTTTFLVRKPVQNLEKSASPLKEEPPNTIDWGEVARIGKLKSFALANKKPLIPTFAVPELPPTSFVKPKPIVVRKPVPSLDERDDQPVTIQRMLGSHPPSPRATNPSIETKPLVRYELSDKPMPKSRTPDSATIIPQMPVQPPAQPKSIPVAVRPSQESQSRPATTSPQPKPVSRPPSIAMAPSPVIEAKPLIRYELTDNPMPKAPPESRAPNSAMITTQLPAQMPPRAPAQPTSLPITARPSQERHPKPMTTPSQSRSGSRHTSVAVTSSSPVEAKPLVRYELTDNRAPTLPEPRIDSAEAATPLHARAPAQLANVSSMMKASQESRSEPTAAPLWPKPEPRPSPPVTPTVPKHVSRYQLADRPVSKPPTRYQLTDPPAPRPPPAPSPAGTPAGTPDDILSNHRANLRPVSNPRPPSPSKFESRDRGSTTLPAPMVVPKTLTKEVTAPSAAPVPRVPAFPLLEGNSERNGAQPLPQVTATRRSPSPQRSRPQKASSQIPTPAENEPAARDQPRTLAPQRPVVESQASQKAKYFESLAANDNRPSVKSQPQNPRQVLRPYQANTSQPVAEPSHRTQVQLQQQAPSQAQPPTQTTLPARATQASPVLSYSLPQREPSPIFTANPVPPTVPTARSLIPVTSSGFEVPVMLLGRDARERADAALREAELFRLKREAIARVPMWVGTEYTPQAPPPTRAVRSPNTVVSPQPHWDTQQSTNEEFTMAELLAREAPVARAVYDPQLKHPRPRPVSSKPPTALLPNDAELLSKYDVRSARGGRGGQVTAVTSIWQNGTGAPTLAADKPPHMAAKRYTAPAGLAPLATKLTPQSEGMVPASPLMSSPGIMKSTSLPAMMHTVQAVPILSSTASLARPAGGPAVRARMMTFAAPIPESQSDDMLVRRTSQSTDHEGVAVGQARLKELIGKYQS